MQPAEFQEKVRSVLETVVDLEPSARHALLAEVESLLRYLGPATQDDALEQSKLSAMDALLEAKHGGQVEEQQVLSASLENRDKEVDNLRYPSAASSALPQVSGYEILGLLGRGGMGVVYRARQLGLNRIVALKMIKEGSLAGVDQLARFKTEAEAIARLQHPNILQIYQVGEHDSQPFFSLELVEGGNLERRVAGQPQPPGSAATLVETLARAVHAAHGQGIIHRDLKPANVLLAADGSPKIGDFGLAKRLDAASGQTHTGEIMGTPSYMAPEQAAGKIRDLGPAVDVYALGAILYELLTGRPPFKGPTSLDTLNQVCSQEPVPPRRLQPGVPRDLDTICLKCLRKMPADRYPSALALAQDLVRFWNGEPIQARPISSLTRLAKWTKRHRALAALVALAVVFFVSLPLGVWLLADSRATAKQLELEKAAAEAEGRQAKEREADASYRKILTEIQKHSASPSLGPASFWVDLEELTQAAALPASARNPAELRTEVAALTTRLGVKEKTRWPMIRGDEFGSSISGINLKQGLLGKLVDQASTIQINCLALSADQRRPLLALAQLRSSIGVCCVRVLEVRTEKVFADLVYTSKARGGTLAFSPDGRWLVLGAGDGSINAWDLHHLSSRFPALSWQAHQGAVVGLSFAPDGKTLYSYAEDDIIRSWTLQAAHPEEKLWKEVGRVIVPGSRPGFKGMVINPVDGSVLACCTHQGLKVVDTRTLKLREVDPRRRSDFWNENDAVAFSPNGRLLASTRNRSIILVDCGRMSILRTLRDKDLEDVAHAGVITSLDFSPDGSLLLSSSVDRSFKIWDVASGRLLVRQTVALETTETPFSLLVPGQASCSVVTAGGTQAIVHELGSCNDQTIVALQPMRIKAADFAPDDRALATLAAEQDHGAATQELAIWSLQSGALVNGWLFSGSLPSPPLGKPSLTYPRQPPGALLVFTTATEAHFWDVASGKASRPPLRIRIDGPPVFSRDGQFLAAGISPQKPDADRELIVWRYPDVTEIQKWQNPSMQGFKGIPCLASGTNYLVVAAHPTDILLFRLGAGNHPERTWSSPGGLVQSVTLSKDETLAAAGTEDGRVWVVRVPDGTARFEFRAHSGPITSVTFSPTEELLATASLDATIRLWKPKGESMEEVMTLPSTTGGVAAIRFCSNGRKLAALVKDETAVRIWHLDRLRQRLKAMNLDW